MAKRGLNAKGVAGITTVSHDVLLLDITRLAQVQILVQVFRYRAERPLLTNERHIINPDQGITCQIPLVWLR